MTTPTNFLDRMANWKSLVVLLIFYASFPAYWLKNAEATINHLAGKPVGVIDLTIGYDPARTLRMVANYGPAARAYYARTELTADVAYPLTYGLLFAVILTLLFRNKAPKLFRWVTLLPLASLLFDYLENAAIVSLLTTYPAQSPTLAGLCEVAKVGKWLSFGLVILSMLYGLLRLVLSKIQIISH